MFQVHLQNVGKASQAQSDLESTLQEAQTKYQGLSSVQQEFQTLKNDMGSIGGTADINGKTHDLDRILNLLLSIYNFVERKFKSLKLFPHSFTERVSGTTE